MGKIISRKKDTFLSKRDFNCCYLGERRRKRKETHLGFVLVVISVLIISAVSRLMKRLDEPQQGHRFFCQQKSLDLTFLFLSFLRCAKFMQRGHEREKKKTKQKDEERRSNETMFSEESPEVLNLTF